MAHIVSFYQWLMQLAMHRAGNRVKPQGPALTPTPLEGEQVDTR